MPLSQDRSLTASSEWRHAIQQVDSAVLSHLRNEVAGGFDEEQFGNRIGFSNLKMYVRILHPCSSGNFTS